MKMHHARVLTKGEPKRPINGPMRSLVDQQTNEQSINDEEGDEVNQKVPEEEERIQQPGSKEVEEQSSVLSLPAKQQIKEVLVETGITPHPIFLLFILFYI